MAQHYNTRITDVGNLIFYLDAVNLKSYTGSGSIWYDVSGNRNHFTLFNSPTYTNNGTIGTYLTFNGTNQYARSTEAINFNQYSAVTIEIGFRSTSTLTQVLYETTGTGGSTATGGITLLMNSNNTSTAANVYLSQWQGYGPRLFGYTVNTNSSFNSIVETFVKGSDSTGRQVYVNGTVAQFFTTTSITVRTSETTTGLAFANTWTFVASRAGTSNFFRGDIAYIRAWGTKINSSNVNSNSAGTGARQVNSYEFPTILTSDPSLAPSAPTYTAAIPTTNLYSHYDFSLLSDAAATSYSTNNQSIPNSSGLLIGAAATTPALSFVTSGVNTPATISTTAGGKKFISIPSANQNQGGFLRSGADAFPDITSAGYSCIAVWRYSPASGSSWVVPPFRYMLAGFSTDFNGLMFFSNSGGQNELELITYSSSGAFVSPGTPNRYGSTGIVIDMITIIGTAVTIRTSINGTASTIYDNNLTAGGAPPVYSTAIAANRYLELGPTFYSNRPAINFYEIAFYSAPLTLSAQTAVFTALYNKWA